MGFLQKISSPASGRPTRPLSEVDRQQPSLTHRSLLPLAGCFTGLKIKVVCTLGNYPTPEPYPWPCSKYFKPTAVFTGCLNAPHKSCFATSGCKIICSVSGALPTLNNKITHKALHTTESQPLTSPSISYLLKITSRPCSQMYAFP